MNYLGPDELKTAMTNTIKVKSLIISDEPTSDDDYYSNFENCDLSEDSNDIMPITHIYRNVEKKIELDGRSPNRLSCDLLLWFEASEDVRFQLSSPCCFLDIPANQKFTFHDPIPIVVSPWVLPTITAKNDKPFTIKAGYATIFSQSKKIQLVKQQPDFNEDPTQTIRWRLVPPDFDTSFIPRLPQRLQTYINEEEERRQWLENGYTYENGRYLFYSNSN